MSKTLKVRESRHESEHEAPNAQARVADLINMARAATDAADEAADTRYEELDGIDPNITDGDAESTNLTGQEAGEGAFEAGTSGDEYVGEADEEFLPDALLGSYPELANRHVAEVIIGTDDRIRVQATTAYPWRAICALRITAANGKRFIGTGWLVSARTVITAGHCIYMHNEGGWVRSVEVIPGLNDSAQPYGRFTGTALRSVTGWTSGKKREHDYGAIILPANARPGATVGTFGFATRSDSFLKAAALNLSGYPGDKGGNQQWFMAQKPKSVSSRVITYNIDTMGGQSGSPVWILQNGTRYAVGIHTNGSGSGNSATRIESSVFNNLVNWKNLGQ